PLVILTIIAQNRIPEPPAIISQTLWIQRQSGGKTIGFLKSNLIQPGIFFSPDHSRIGTTTEGLQFENNILIGREKAGKVRQGRTADRPLSDLRCIPAI